MEQTNCTEQEVDIKQIKSESVAQSETITSNGFADDESTKGTLKRKYSPTESDENDGKKYVKQEDHGGGDIPAHHARRPPNGFLLFCKRHRDIVSAKNPNLENRGVTKLLGNWWKTLEEEERGKYKELARLNKEVFIANNPQFTWYKLPAPPLRTLVTRPSNRRPPKLETSPINPAGPITPGKLADESQLGGLTNLLSSSVSPPSTPYNPSPPSPTSTAPAHPKKRFLLQTRAKQDAGNSLSESDEGSDNNKSIYKSGKKSYKKKKNWNSLKYKRNLKMKWNDSFSNKLCLDADAEDHGGHTWKADNGSPNCTQQQLIEKIVDSSFDSQKSIQNFDIQRKLDYINTEHTYQKNPGRFWQQKQKVNKKEQCVPLQIVGKIDGMEQNLISPNVNNNTILITEAETDVKKENGLNEINYSYNDTKLISDYVDTNQRRLDQSSIQTNHDRISSNNIEDGYIPDKYARKVQEDCDKMGGLEDQYKPLKVTQDPDIPKNCDKDSNFQSILGKVSREIGNMINERSPESTEEGDLAVAKFNIQSRSDSDSDESYYDKSDTVSPPESPGGGRRSKRSCKGQRYEQFIKDSVSKKRSKNPDLYNSIEFRKAKRKKDFLNPSSDEFETIDRDKRNVDSDEHAQTDAAEPLKEEPDNGIEYSEDLNVKQGTKASEIIKMKLDKESKMKRDGVDERTGKKQKESKMKLKKKPMSKVQMIKERRELHIGEFNLNEKIEELPLHSFESFLQKKRQRKKRLLCLKKEGMKNRSAKSKLDKYKNRDSRTAVNSDANLVPSKTAGHGQNTTKPDFANLATLADAAVKLLSQSEPRNSTIEEDN